MCVRRHRAAREGSLGGWLRLLCFGLLQSGFRVCELLFEARNFVFESLDIEFLLRGDSGREREGAHQACEDQKLVLSIRIHIFDLESHHLDSRLRDGKFLPGWIQQDEKHMPSLTGDDAAERDVLAGFEIHGYLGHVCQGAIANEIRSHPRERVDFAFQLLNFGFWFGWFVGGWYEESRNCQGRGRKEESEHGKLHGMRDLLHRRSAAKWQPSGLRAIRAIFDLVMMLTDANQHHNPEHRC